MHRQLHRTSGALCTTLPSGELNLIGLAADYARGQVSEIEKGTSAWQSNLNIGDRVDMIDGVPVRGKSQRLLAGENCGAG